MHTGFIREDRKGRSWSAAEQLKKWYTFAMQQHRDQAPFFLFSSNNKGVTLIEIITVLIILAVMGAAITSRILDSSANLMGETEVVKSHLRYAQMKAMNDNVTWGIDFNGSSYTLQQDGADSGILPGQNSFTYTLSTGTASATTDPIVFDTWGDPGAAITVTVTDASGNQTFTVANITGFIP